MIEVFIIIIQFVCIAIAILYIRNLLLTIKNIQTMIQDTTDLVNKYSNFVDDLNSKTTYYGDPTIEELVAFSNRLKDELTIISDIEDQLFGIEEDYKIEEDYETEEKSEKEN